MAVCWQSTNFPLYTLEYSIILDDFSSRRLFERIYLERPNFFLSIYMDQ